LIGQTISHYRILEKLGQGGMGVVYKAEDTKLDRTVALKFLADHLTAHEELRQRFIREAKAAASLNHSNICTVHEIGEDGGKTFIAMAYLGGATLEKRLEEGPLPIDEAVRLGAGIAGGLAAAHDAGVVHRDVKPSNIVVTEPRAGEDAQAVLMDFGLAQLARESTKLTQEGSTIGTAGYMSPEQAQGSDVDHRSDIWSFGVVLYEMVAGRSPFAGDYQQAILYSVLNDDPEPLSALRPDTPAELQSIIDKTLAKKPGERYQSADELTADLRVLQRLQESGSDVTPAPAPKRSSRRVIAAAAAVVVLAAGAAFWLGGRQAPQPPAPLENWTVKPLTTYPGRELHPTFSPDGQQVAFAWDGGEGDQLDIYVQFVGSGSPVRLTDHPVSDISPAWSPDGRSIAFRRVDPYQDAIYLISPLGGTERKLIEGRFGSRTAISWSPDGTFIAATPRNEATSKYGIVLIDVATRETRELTSPNVVGAGDRHPRFSHSGKYIAFVRDESTGVARTMVVPRGGGQPSVPTEETWDSSSQFYGLTWSRDDNFIYHSGRRARTGEDGLFRIPVGGGELRRLTSLGSAVGHPELSVSSGRLAFSRDAMDLNLRRINLRSDGSSESSLVASSTRIERDPEISPDGQRIVFVSERSGTKELWLADSSGANAMQLTDIGGPSVGSPSWSPDSRQIAFDLNRDGYIHSFVVSVDGGAPRQLTFDNFNHARPTYSHDGRWLYFNSNRSGEMTIWKMPAEGGEAVQLSEQRGNNAFESPDGKYVYFGGYGGPGLWRVPVEGGEAEQVSNSIRGAAGYWAFAQDGTLYFISRGDGLFTIKRFDPETRVESWVADIGSVSGTVGNITVSHDGSWFIVTDLDEQEADLMLVEGFE